VVRTSVPQTSVGLLIPAILFLMSIPAAARARPIGAIPAVDPVGNVGAAPATGDSVRAIQNYERSLELDPGNDNARRNLEELRRVDGASERGVRILPTPESIADGLRSLVVVSNRTSPDFSLPRRMAHYRVPGVGIALIRDGQVAWAAGYGVADTESGAPVTEATLFRACSISKPISAAGALRLVSEGVLALDTPAGRYLRSWRFPANPFTGTSPITLRQLLSHTSGLTDDPELSCPAGGEIPTLAQTCPMQRVPAAAPSIAGWMVVKSPLPCRSTTQVRAPADAESRHRQAEPHTRASFPRGFILPDSKAMGEPEC